MKVLECSQHYTFIFKRSRAANSVVGDEIWQKFKLIQAFIDVLVTSKNDEDPFKNERTRVLTTVLPLQVYGDFFRRSRAASSVDPGPILPNFKPFQAFFNCPCNMREGIRSN